MLPDASDKFQEDLDLTRDARGEGVPSIGMVISLVGFGVLVGLLVAWISFRSPWSSWSPPTVLYDQQLVTLLVEEASPAVVEVSVSRFGSVDKGSGFLVDGLGHIVTNNHVVQDSGDISVRLHDGRVVDAVLLGTSPADDLAILEVDPDDVDGIAPLRLADSGKVRPGQLAVAIGSPFQQLNSVTVGVVNGVGRSEVGNQLRRPMPELVQTDATLNPGNSGGPLLNADGEVIGVNSAVQIRASARDLSIQTGLGFAVSSNTLSDLLPYLVTPGEFKRPWLGVESTQLNRSQFRSLDLPVEAGVYITHVCHGSPADIAGLRGERFSIRPTGRGDLITAIDEYPVVEIGDMVSHLNTLRPGAQVVLTIMRSKKPYTVDVTLAEWENTCQ
jgi:S1-C subfamily serine protease